MRKLTDRKEPTNWCQTNEGNVEVSLESFYSSPVMLRVGYEDVIRVKSLILLAYHNHREKEEQIGSSMESALKF